MRVILEIDFCALRRICSHLCRAFEDASVNLLCVTEWRGQKGATLCMQQYAVTRE